MRLGNSSIAKLKYLLHVCTLTYAECESIILPTIRGVLSRARISSCIRSEFRDESMYSLNTGVLSLFHYSDTSRTAMVTD